MALLIVGSRRARAEWQAMRVTPGSVSAYERLLQVKIKTVGRAKVCTVTIAAKSDGQEDAIKDWSNGSLYFNPKAAPPVEPPKVRGVSVPISEKRTDRKVIYTFRLPPGKLRRTRFEFWDSASEDSHTMGGGTLYWFNLNDFLPPGKSVRR